MIRLSTMFAPSLIPLKIPGLDLLNGPFPFAAKTLMFVVLMAQ